MTKHTPATKLPLTAADNSVRQVWAQMEYVACMQRGFKFTAHRDHWHYLINEMVVTVHVPMFGQPKELYRFKVKEPINWIEEARAAIARTEGEDR